MRRLSTFRKVLICEITLIAILTITLLVLIGCRINEGNKETVDVTPTETTVETVKPTEEPTVLPSPTLEPIVEEEKVEDAEDTIVEEITIKEPITSSSDYIREVIRGYEGFTATAIWDYSNYSIGFGHTSSEVKEGDTITREDAIKLFNEDIKKIDNRVIKFVNENNLELTQEQFDALVCFWYNLGTQKDLLNLIVDYFNGDATQEEVVTLWLKYCHAGGKVLNGLVKRRTFEVNLFFGIEQ